VDRNWANQPKIHRRWFGCPVTPLPVPPEASFPTVSYDALHEGGIDAVPLSLDSVSKFLFFSAACAGTKDAYHSTSVPFRLFFFLHLVANDSPLFSTDWAEK
jgi:hypothetical protein